LFEVFFFQIRFSFFSAVVDRIQWMRLLRSLRELKKDDGLKKVFEKSDVGILEYGIPATVCICGRGLDDDGLFQGYVA